MDQKAKKAKQAERARRLYHTNETYRQNQIRYSSGRHRIPDDAPEHLKTKTYRMYLYATDPAFRERVLQVSRAYRAAKRAAKELEECV